MCVGVVIPCIHFTRNCVCSELEVACIVICRLGNNFVIKIGSNSHNIANIHDQK